MQPKAKEKQKQVRKPQLTDILTAFGQKFLEIYITNFTYYWRGKKHSQYLVMDIIN